MGVKGDRLSRADGNDSALGLASGRAKETSCATAFMLP